MPKLSKDTTKALGAINPDSVRTAVTKSSSLCAKIGEINKAQANAQDTPTRKPAAKSAPSFNSPEDLQAIAAVERVQIQRTIGALGYGTGGHSDKLMIVAGAASVTPVEAKHAPSAADVREAGGLPPNARMDGDNPDVLVGAMRAARAAR